MSYNYIYYYCYQLPTFWITFSWSRIWFFSASVLPVSIYPHLQINFGSFLRVLYCRSLSVFSRKLRLRLAMGIKHSHTSVNFSLLNALYVPDLWKSAVNLHSLPLQNIFDPLQGSNIRYKCTYFYSSFQSHGLHPSHVFPSHSPKISSLDILDRHIHNNLFRPEPEPFRTCFFVVTI
jgi:hypothetical protein